MSVSVRKFPSLLVRPPEQVSMGSTIKLSSFDMAQDNKQVAALLMFEDPIHDTANTIMRALSQALVHYYPIAGRIVAGADNDVLHIQCNGEGVAFVSASANCALKEVMLLDNARTLQDELVPRCPTKDFGATDPLLLMQVTQFSCRGFVLGVRWNHIIADGVGMAQFLQAVGELARGLSSPSIIPVRWDDSLPRPPPSVTSLEPQQPVTSLEPIDDLCWLEITVHSGLINRIKAEFCNRFAGQTCTKFEAASAVLWQCRTRAIMCNPETPALFLFAADARKLVAAKKGYYGNCVTGQLVMATSGTIASGDIFELVKMIKDSKEKIADQLKYNQGINPQQEAGQVQQLAQLRYNLLIVTSWGNLGFDEVDFGSGMPARVTPLSVDNPPFPVCAMCLPWKAKDGVNMISIMLKKEHVDGFVEELARFR